MNCRISRKWRFLKKVNISIFRACMTQGCAHTREKNRKSKLIEKILSIVKTYTGIFRYNIIKL